MYYFNHSSKASMSEWLSLRVFDLRVGSELDALLSFQLLQSPLQRNSSDFVISSWRCFLAVLLDLHQHA